MQMQDQNTQQMPAVQMYPPQSDQQATMLPPPMVENKANELNQQNASNTASQSACAVSVKCPKCNIVSTTMVSTKPGKGTYMCCVFLFFCSGLFFLPFCIDQCKDKVHKCPHCQHVVGTNEYKIF